MAITFACSECEEDVKVKDELAGHRIKCPRCGESTRVPAGNETAVAAGPPARKAKEQSAKPTPPDDDADEERRPAKKKKKKAKAGSSTGLIIGIGAAAALLLVGGIVGAVLLRPKPPQEQAKAPPQALVPVQPEEKKEPVKPDLNKVDIGKGKRQVTSVRERIGRTERVNELRQIATFYQGMTRPPQKAEEFIKHIGNDASAIKKAIEERYYVVVSNVKSGIVAYEHDPDNTGRHGIVNHSASVDNISTEELITQLKAQGSWSDDGNRPRK